MRQIWFERCNIPLRRSVPKFEVRRIQTMSRALTLIDSRRVTPDSRVKSTERPFFGYELPVSSLDDLVIGKIDAVLPSASGAVVQDYKSGQVFVETLGGGRVIKEAIETQLRMYAALYANTSGNWPTRLEVVPLHGAAHTVNFDSASSNELVEAARCLLNSTNETIVTLGHDRERIETDLAAPSKSNCKYCQYRPGCRPYAKAAVLGDPDWPADVHGKVVDIVTLANSSLALTIETEGGNARIRGITSSADRHPALADAVPGASIACFNLSRTQTQLLFAEATATTIYRCEIPLTKPKSTEG